MNGDIELISDGEGLAVIGEPANVELFLTSEGLTSKELGLHRLVPTLGAGAAVAQAGSEMAANSGRWVKLSKESAELLKKYELRTSSKTSLPTGVIKGKNGQIAGFVEFVKGPGTVLANPAILAGAAGIMAQVAMQQAMDEVTDYLAAIDQKVDAVIRAQKDAVLARVIGIGLVIDEAMATRQTQAKVDEVTWSKVQHAPGAIAETQAYALEQLVAIAESLERKGGIGDLARAAQIADTKCREWLAVLARCVQLQDGIAILELDRVLDAAPQELEGHRQGLKAARRRRLELIEQQTEHILDQIDAIVGVADSKVLMHPTRSPAVVQSMNRMTTAVVDFHVLLEIEQDREPSSPRRWAEAAKDLRDDAVDAGTEGVDAARRLGATTVSRVRTVADGFSARIAARKTARRDPQEDQDSTTSSSGGKS